MPAPFLKWFLLYEFLCAKARVMVRDKTKVVYCKSILSRTKHTPQSFAKTVRAWGKHATLCFTGIVL